VESKINVGIIGAGNIAPAYIKGCRAFDILNLAGITDIDMEKARKVAAEHNIDRVYTVEEMLADPSIQIVINLTIPAVHAQVSHQIISAGKHVYSEKPLATTLEDGRAVIAAAQAKGVLVGCAPDTFLFGEHQTVRKLIDDDCIGEPVAAVGFMAGRGPESWHPNPDFFYAPGGGPMFDMGPYYVTCLVTLLGPAVRVSGAAKASFPQRVAKDGHTIPVGVPTHYTATIEFASGAVATLITSFDVWAHHLPMMEIYGSKGSIVVPDPNGYWKHVKLFVPGEHEWDEMEMTHSTDWARGIGTADMAYALTYGRPHRASGDLALHVLEIMDAVSKAYESGTYVTLTTTVERPAALPVGLPERQLDK
jgi:predicted dehydrogenase